MPSRIHSNSNTLYSVGHSNRTVEQFLDILKAHGIQKVVDIRTISQSRRNPQFNQESLRESLKKAHILYEYLKELGGLRHPVKDSHNTGWENLSFRGFADYMATLDFKEGLDRLKKIAMGKKTVMMCAEAVPWRCHRSLIADALTKQKWQVFHIQGKRTAHLHKLTPFLRIHNGKLVYPKNVNIRMCWTTSEDLFPLPTRIKEIYGPFGFPNPPDDRPYTTSNFVMGLDGRASFREFQGRTSGREVSRSKEDRWLMDFLRAHHDAQIIGGNTLREEVGPDRLGWDYSIEDEELLEYRDKKLKLGRTKVIIVSGSGNLNLRLRVFNSSKVEPWIVTTDTGAKIIELQMKGHWKGTPLKVISMGKNNPIDLKRMMLSLRREYGIGTLLCEGGPNFYGQLLDLKLIDEDFRTIATQVLGESTQPNIERPTAYGQVSYMPETAPWFRIISIHCSPPYHIFLRLRYEGPREFGD